MATINYLSEINAIHDREFNHPLSAVAFKLLLKLYFLANREGWPEWVRVSNGLLSSLVGCSENALLEARRQLIAGGWVRYDGKKRTTPRYSIIYQSNNRKICGYSGGYSGDYSGGYSGGNGEDMSIDKDIDGDPEEEQANNPLSEDAREGEAGSDDPELHSRDPRTEAMADHCCQQLRDHPDFLLTFRSDGERVEALRLYRRGIICGTMDDDAVVRTMERAAEKPLGNPLAYCHSLIHSWAEFGIRTPEELELAKARGDYVF